MADAFVKDTLEKWGFEAYVDAFKGMPIAIVIYSYLPKGPTNFRGLGWAGDPPMSVVA